MNPYQAFKYVPLSVLQTQARIAARLIMRLPELSIVRTIKINMQLIEPALTTAENKTLVKDIVLNQCLSSVESVKSWAMSPQWSIDQIREVHNKELLVQGLANPNGMLAIVPHLGTWEMMNAWLNQFGSPTIMYKPVKNKLINDFVLQGRARLNATLVPTNSNGVKAVFRTLKNGGFSIILPDHVPEPSGGVVVPFFGVETLSSTLASKLASKTKCALVGLSCIRRQDSQGFDIYCYQLDDPALYDKDVANATKALNHQMQQMIHEHFSHYPWGYRRFKRLPNLGNPYRSKDSDVAAFIAANRHQADADE